MSDEQAHGHWDKAQQRYEDGEKSHPCVHAPNGPDWAGLREPSSWKERALAAEAGDVTGPRWAGGTRNPDDAAKAVSLEELRMSPAERIMFMAGRASRDSEVEELRQAQQEQWYQNDVTLAAKNKVLREQLAAAALRETLAKATLKRIYKMAVEDDARAWDSHWPLIALITEPYRTGDTNA